MTILSTQPQRTAKAAVTVALSLCLAAAVSLANIQLFAAEETEPKTSEQTSESTATDATKQAQTDQKKLADDKKDSKKNKEIFRPSEEISEDFAVSFPVDI